MKSVRLLALLAAAVGAACTGSTEPRPLPTGSEVILELGKSAQLDGTGITVTFTSVEDSRCPTGAQCIWEGNGHVALEVRSAGGAPTTGELNTHPSYPNDLTYRYVRLALAELDPYPTLTANKVEYRAHLRWSYLPD